MANRPVRYRMCVACREAKPQREMVRVVRNCDGVVTVDESGKADGRGAYICKSAACIEKAIREKRLEKALKTKIESAVFEKIGEIHA